MERGDEQSTGPRCFTKAVAPALCVAAMLDLDSSAVRLILYIGYES